MPPRRSRRSPVRASTSRSSPRTTSPRRSRRSTSTPASPARPATSSPRTARRGGPSRNREGPAPTPIHLVLQTRTSPIATNPITVVPVAVLDDDPEVRDRLASQLGGRAEPFASLGEVEARLAGDPLVLVLGPSCGSASRLAEVGRALQSHREVGTVLVTDELSTDLLQTALRAGVNDVLATPVESAQLEASVARVADGLEESGVRVSDGGADI